MRFQLYSSQRSAGCRRSLEPFLQFEGVGEPSSEPRSSRPLPGTARRPHHIIEAAEQALQRVEAGGIVVDRRIHAFPVPPIWNVMDASAIAARKTSVRGAKSQRKRFLHVKILPCLFFGPLREAGTAEYVLSIAKLSVLSTCSAKILCFEFFRDRIFQKIQSQRKTY